MAEEATPLGTQSIQTPNGEVTITFMSDGSTVFITDWEARLAETIQEDGHVEFVLLPPEPGEEGGRVFLARPE